MQKPSELGDGERSIATDTGISTRTVPPEIEKELALRLYRWALADAEREVLGDFPLVRTVRNSDVFGFLAYCATLPQQDLLKIIRRRVRLSHPTALAYLGEIKTPAEQQYLEGEFQAQRVYGDVYTRRLNERFGPDSVYSTKNGVMAVLKEAMRPAFGERRPSRHKVVSIYETVFPQRETTWHLETRIGVLEKHQTLRYTQSLYMPDHEWAVTARDPSHQASDIMGWLGISLLPTYWDIPFACDVEQAVSSLALICEHYLRAVPSIIEGLAI